MFSTIIIFLYLRFHMQVERTEVLYWKVSRPEAYSPSRFPSFIGHMGDYKEEFYGIPVNEYPGMLKVVLYISMSVCVKPNSHLDATVCVVSRS